MERIILDTDLAMGAPGSDVDDGFALALAYADPGISLELITTVNGNTDVETATILTAELLRRLGAEVPIVKGGAAAAAEIARCVLASPGEITVVAIGPLTNVAAALVLEPRVAAAVKEIVIMGGSFFGTPAHRISGSDGPMMAEFNAWTDPEAAAAVLRCGAPQRWVGLDVTLQVRVTRDHARRMLASPTPFAPYAGEATLAWIDHLRDSHPGSAIDADSCAMHDPLAVAVLTRPELVEFVDAAVSVVTGDGESRGVMITDLLGSADSPPANCRVAATVDADGFLDHFLGLLAGL